MDCWCPQHLDVAFEGTLKLINAPPDGPLGSTTWNSWVKGCELHLLVLPHSLGFLVLYPLCSARLSTLKGLYDFSSGAEQLPCSTLKPPTGRLKASMNLFLHCNVCGGWDAISLRRVVALLPACLHVKWILLSSYFSFTSQHPLCLLDYVFIFPSASPMAPSWVV